MKIELSEIAGNPGMHATIPIEQKCPTDPELKCKAPVKGEISFSNSGTLLLLNGKIETTVALECGRCLTDFEVPVEAILEEEFRLEQVGDAIQALPMDEEDLEEEVVVQNNVLDLDELIRQNLLIALPIQPICKPECQGLCPTCGENLNVRKCICHGMDTESPFQALAGLLEEDRESNETQEQEN